MKLEGDLFPVVIEILKNWEKPTIEVVEQIDQRLNRMRIEKAIKPDAANNIEMVLRKIFNKNRKITNRGISISPKIVLKMDTEFVKINHQGTEMTTDVMFTIEELEGFTFLTGASQNSPSFVILRYIKGNPFNLRELYNSYIDPVIENSNEMWGEFDQFPEEIHRPVKSKSIYQLLQQCLECQTTQPSSIRECVNCNSELPFCQICKLGYNTSDELTKCPSCLNMFHKSHFYAWVQSKGICGICKEKVTLSQI